MLFRVFIFMALFIPFGANAEVVIGNQLSLTGTSAIVGGTLDARRIVGFTMDSQDFELTSVDISLDHGPTRSAPVVELFGGTSNGPTGSPLLTFDNPQMGLGKNAYTFLPPSSQTLESGESYWLSVRALFLTSTGRFFWAGSHAGSEPTGDYASYEGFQYEFNTTSLQPEANDYGFRVKGSPVSAVPEPSSFTLFLGLGLLAAVRRRWQRWMTNQLS